jgi:toxin ParE1/3/4
MRALIVEPQAEQELGDAIRWYEDREAGLGAALISELDATTGKLRRGELPPLVLPELGPNSQVRRVLLDRFPYAVVFVEHDDGIHVIAFAHHKRQPSYWRDRL